MTMALRDFWRSVRGPREPERERYPLDPLSRDSWHDEAEARYGSHFYRDFDDERRPDPDYDQRRFNERWENSYSGPGQGRFASEERGDSYGGSSNNPFYGDRPLIRGAGSDYDTSYFGSKTGLPMTQWRQDADPGDYDDLVYGGRDFDADGSAAAAEARGHRGRGPRGYSRSDDRIKEDVCQCLTDDHYIDATNVDVTVKDREVVLSGTVSSRMQKRRAEDLIERLPGVRDVINSLRVSTEASGTASSGAQQPRLGSYR
jgi:hypothetical protein